jgi:DNA transformation protein and related proteins
MDREFLTDLFADFGPVTIRPMFSGHGISVDGINFALALRAGLFFRADEQTIPRFEAEGSKPFSYQTTTRSVTVASYWQLPARLFDDTEELGEWARAALGAAKRAALKKRPRKPRKAKNTQAKNTQAKNTQAKNTQAKNTQAKNTQPKNTQPKAQASTKAAKLPAKARVGKAPPTGKKKARPTEKRSAKPTKRTSARKVRAKAKSR